MRNLYRYCGSRENMNTKLWPGFIVLAVVFGSFGAFAQVPVQPGQIAPRTAAVDTTANAPIRLSATGELPYEHSLQSVHSVSGDREHRMATIWKISIATMLAASAWDAASSMGKVERNPLLASSDGTFGGKGLGVKFGLAGLSLAPQLLLRNHKELRKVFAIANFVDAGIFAAVAAHNLGIEPVKH
jgi:hypothetical protein